MNAQNAEDVADWEPCPGLENVVQRFICKTPALGVAYQVLREEWDYDEDGMARRTIYEVRLIDGTGCGS